MQGQRGAIGSLPESLAFEQGSASSDVEQQICWNNIRSPSSNRLSEYISSPNTSTAYQNSMNQEGQNINIWSIGEAGSSSAPNQVSQSHFETKTEHGWPPQVKAYPEPPASMLSLGDVNMNATHNHANHDHHGPLFVQSSRPESVPHNVTVNPSTFIGFKPFSSPETHSGSLAGGSSSHPLGPTSDPFEQEGRHLPCKRKAVELSVGSSSSGVGSSNLWHENPIAANATPSDQMIPRLGLGVEEASSESSFVENNRRNVRLRISSCRQQDVLPANNDHGQPSHSSPFPALALNPADLRSPPLEPTTENSSGHDGQHALRLPALRRHLQASSRWSRSSSSRANRSSNVVISGDNPRTALTNISDHPIFVQPNETRNTSQNAGNWSVNGVASSSRASPSSVPPPSSVAPDWVPHHRSSHRRLSEVLRRSLLSMDSEDGGGLNSNVFSRIPPAVGSPASSSQDAEIPPVAGNQVRHHPPPHSRSSVLLDRHLDIAFGFPYLSRTMAVGSEGRGRLVSEMRNVLDLIRRGEGLRIEDVLMLEQSVFHGMADIHDRHRDMRLDIDNMSYEELLALEERIGNVNTGLSEETISKHLKLKKHESLISQPDTEPCCICQEEYNNGDALGGLECGHDFHTNCIKQWLLQKNLCPICKSTAFATP